MSVARWPVDSNATIHESLARRVDIVDPVRKVAKIAAFAVLFRVPIVGKLDLRFFIAGCCQEDQRKTPLFVIDSPELNEAQFVALEIQRLVYVADAHHSVEVFHGYNTRP